ncbi:ClpP/crotonase-like domain-containing protein [Dunaliella salina]|uniref:ClpP/crotonase-like domain-containing protein n=1 Tax=Dunaliella salina TaxID=3046 RepID=A0ABQ7FWD5_DUNSA|nr:ClpP/crotonase-like domain-containing protein [Dunaliella salina]|eukprot:KAF5826678.1 ClpP/crotonase-like domain-containing protein [Dunaliella salina]
MQLHMGLARHLPLANRPHANAVCYLPRFQCCQATPDKGEHPLQNKGPALWQHKLEVARGAAALAASLLLCGPTLLPSPALALPTFDVGRTINIDRGSHALEIHRPSNVAQAQQQQQQQQQMDSSPDEPVGDVSSELEDRLVVVARQIETGIEGFVEQLVPSMPGSQPASPEEREAFDAGAHQLIREVWEVVDGNYLDARSSGWNRERWAQIRDNALAQHYSDTTAVHRAVKEMIAFGLNDPYCRFIQPAELQSMKKYDVTGVGLNLGTAEEYVLKTNRALPEDRPTGPTGIFVVGLSKNSPADKVGVEQGDQLLEVDGTSLHDKTPFQVASTIAGADPSTSSSAQPNPYVQLKVRKLDGSVTDVRVERPVRQISSPVSSSLGKMGGEPVGILRLTSFNARAQRDLASAILSLEKQGAKSFVLDLRDNRGGLVSEGLEVARLFLEGSSPLVYTESRSIPAGAPRAQSPALTHLPLMVLVNEHTASASEIVAGALQDNCRAVLVGNRTYGKGLIQSVYELSDGSGMVLTVGKYLTPNQTDIDRSGIRPNFSSKPSFQAAAETLQACKVPRT